MMPFMLVAAAVVTCNVCDYEGATDGFYTVAAADCPCTKVNRSCPMGTYGVVVPPGTPSAHRATSYYVQHNAAPGVLRKAIFDADGTFHVTHTDFNSNLQTVDARGAALACPTLLPEFPALPAGSGFARVGDGVIRGSTPASVAIIVGSVVLGAIAILCGIRSCAHRKEVA